MARNLQKLANEEIKAAQQDYEAVKARTNEELATMEAELKACAGKVTDARESLRTLKSYKDKEHAVNQLRINKLNAEIEQLRVDNLDSLKDLKGKLCTRQLSQVRMVENMKDEARIKSVVVSHACFHLLFCLCCPFFIVLCFLQHLIHELPDPIQEMAKENKRLVMVSCNQFVSELLAFAKIALRSTVCLFAWVCLGNRETTADCDSVARRDAALAERSTCAQVKPDQY